MSLRLLDIHKYFGPVRANDGVTLEVEAGELHGLLGENGAGKSTLMKILSGFYLADSGNVILDGKRLELNSPDDALRHGIGMLHQDPLVFLPLSVVDNFLIGSPGHLQVDRRKARKDLLEVCGRFGFDLNPDAAARELTIGERQQLEIVRLLWLGARVLILDEPTTGISETQREKLFATLKALAAEGMIVIFVSHKLEEVQQLCSKVTVLRAGRVVGAADLPCPTDQLVEMMFGEVVVTEQRQDVELGPPALTVRDVTLRDDLLTIEHLSLTVRSSEVVGLAGLVGSGQRTFLRAAAGLLKPVTGSLFIGDQDMSHRSYRDFLEAGVHYLPAGRLEEGLLAGITLTEHFVLAGGETSFFIDWGAAERRAATLIEEHFIVGRPDSTAEELSGGNQQRLLLAMTPDELRVLLMQHPTRGLDIESANWVWRQLLKRRDDGTAIVFASSDLDELLEYSDRIAVFFSGEILDVIDTAGATVEQLGYLIGGVRKITA
ncbi:ribose import ATP-binding protein RbsA [bacterium BMS3Abin02]|nr:ribose import ATP-binding protein RbsA [bacterium BMS3Abin02]GBE21245.1 ribose import ATP-binding protein RbsA [bacterium BMS3Bbin01]HDH25849.1 ATP-binding cassette domain-containing protein [Actinomycetota bacterium]HDL48559.1 ATP-binding cassette domain-containing protein [Actinomycetota bacterium]